MKSTSASPFRSASILAALVFCFLSSSCSYDSKTYYAADSIYTVDQVPRIHFQRFRTRDFLLRTEREAANYLVAANFVAGAEVSTVQLSDARILLDDGVDDRSGFVPIKGTPLVIQIRNDVYEATSIFVCDTSNGKRDLIAKFPGRGLDPKHGVAAITRSESQLLVVTEDRAGFWNPARKRIIESGAGSLVELRRLIMQIRGRPGIWRLTDDLRYVVISPPLYTETTSGQTKGREPLPITIAGTEANIQEQGLVYDRTTGKFAVFPLKFDYDFDSLADVENVNGKLEFVYVNEYIAPTGLLYPSRNARTEVTDITGNVIAQHSVDNETSETGFAGWDPDHGELWYHVGQGTSPGELSRAESDHAFIRWNASTNTETRYKVTVDQIQKALEKAK